MSSTDCLPRLTQPLPGEAPIEQAQKISVKSSKIYTVIWRDLRYLGFELCHFMSPSDTYYPEYPDFGKPDHYTPCLAARRCTIHEDYVQANALRREAKALHAKMGALCHATARDLLQISELKREGICAGVWRRLRKGGVEMTPMLESVEAVWRLQEEPKEVRKMIWEWQKFRVSVKIFLEEPGENAGEKSGEKAAWNGAVEEGGKGPRCDECGTLCLCCALVD